MSQQYAKRSAFKVFGLWVPLSLVATSLILSSCSSSSREGKKVKIESFEEKFSYMVGYQVGRSLKEQNIEADIDVLMAGIADQLAGRESQLSQEEMQAVMMEMSQKQMAADQEETSGNLEAAEKFLVENKAKEGISEIEKGLQYQVLSAGTGPKPSATDSVKVHYRGTLLDGSQFDSSYDRGEPISFPLNRVIPGWTNALQQMPVGSKWKLFIHPDLAYGPQTRPGIPGNSLLIFEVELLDIEG